MTLPSNLFAKYLMRFDELIQQGQKLYDSIKIQLGDALLPHESLKMFDDLSQIGSGIEIVDLEALAKWRINYASLLDQVIPKSSTQRRLIENPGVCYSKAQDLENRLAALKAIREDFEHGFLGDLMIQVEAEVAANYLEQAEHLLTEGSSGKFDHVPAAVLSGAVLEKALKTLCIKQQPPISIMKEDGAPLKLTLLISELKKVGVYNELKSKQLLAWADIRNAAAHGDFDRFRRDDVELMLKGVKNFLATHL